MLLVTNQTMQNWIKQDVRVQTLPTAVVPLFSVPLRKKNCCQLFLIIISHFSFIPTERYLLHLL